MKVGDKVVSIGSSETNCGEHRVIDGEIYTVSGFDYYFGHHCIYLEETGNALWGKKFFRKIEPHNFKNELTKELAESHEELDRLEIPEKETV